MPDAKGKQTESNGVLPPLPNPASGSANPAASFSSLWAYLTPALDHIVKSSTNNPAKAPAIDLEFYSGIHSSCYNYMTSSTSSSDKINTSTGQREEGITTGLDLYDQLDRYFASTARELMLGSPQDDSTLIHYLVPCFNRYSVGAQSVNRLLNYVNRHYVKRAVDEDRGWLTVNDVLGHILESANRKERKDSRDKLSQKMKEKRFDELRKWGYHDGCSASTLASAEAAAEAATGLDRIVPLASLAHRRFRVEFIEPLLAIPKTNKKKKKKLAATAPANGSGPSTPPPPKGRLARAVKELLESPDVSEESRTELASGLAELLRKVGVRPDHPLRKKLEKYAPKLE